MHTLVPYKPDYDNLKGSYAQKLWENDPTITKGSLQLMWLEGQVAHFYYDYEVHMITEFNVTSALTFCNKWPSLGLTKAVIFYDKFGKNKELTGKVVLQLCVEVKRKENVSLTINILDPELADSDTKVSEFIQLIRREFTNNYPRIPITLEKKQGDDVITSINANYEEVKEEVKEEIKVKSGIVVDIKTGEIITGEIFTMDDYEGCRDW
jgi:hypothetical protein